MHVTRLDNGLTLVSQPMAGHRSTAFGIWLAHAGLEPPLRRAGYAHILEHMLFPSAPEQLSQMDRWGGQLNAHTGRELLCFYGLVPGRCLDTALPWLITQLLDAPMTARRLDHALAVTARERADSPVDSAEAALQQLWQGSSLNWPILGDTYSLNGLNIATLEQFGRHLMSGTRIVVAAAGALEHGQLEALCQDLAALPPGTPARFECPPVRSGNTVAQACGEELRYTWALPFQRRGTQSDDALIIGETLLSGGLSGNLLRQLRHEQAWVYGLESRIEWFGRVGAWLLQLQCPRNHGADCLALVDDTLRAWIAAAPDQTLIDLARAYLQARVELEADDPMASMERMARETLLQGAPCAPPDLVARLQAGAAALEVQEQVRAAWSRRLEPARLPPP